MKIETEEMYWALGVSVGDETQTVETFAELSDALKALKNCPDRTAFIDQWSGDNHIGNGIYKTELKGGE